ncbi:MAG TPA: response regulator [Burkholderiales bacterium]|nr:response regulator [Burkholderiales bacterium]
MPLPEPRSAPKKRGGAGAPPLRILVADDERDTVNMLMAILRDEGHVVHGVYSGKDVLPAALLLRPDVLICDIAIPGLSGYAVAQAMRHAFIPARLPLMIAITGFWKETPDRLVAQQVGFDHHLLKPCDSSHLLELLAPVQARQPGV